MGGASKLLVLLSTPFPRLCPRSSFFRLARPAQFPLPSFPAAFVAQHRFPFSSSSHPSHGLPPSAARQMHTQTGRRVDWGEPSASPADHKVSFHPWPELSTLVEHLNSIGYADRRVPPAHGEDDDSFLAPEELPEDFRRMAGLCLLYARERPDLLRSLSKRDIEVVVDNGSPFLFKNGSNTVRRLKSFIGGDGSEVLESEQACTVDVMRYLLSYACNYLASTGVDVTRCREVVESSVRNLLCELVKIDVGIQEPNTTNSTARLNPFGYEQSPKPLRQNIEMKRGDWICPKCTFMNFARNMKCLGCYEVCPKRQLTDGEWECPQCDFFNYARNMTCLRCDCKRPGEISSSGKPSIEQLLSAGNVDRAEIERRLAENDEKAERWFSKVSQLDDSSDVSSAIADEDFPEIMPLRKGTNRFVISTRRTPLERRLANAQYRKNLGNEGSYMGNDSLRMGSNKMSESAISHTLDRILGRSSAASGTSDDAGNQIGSREPSGSSFTSAESKEQTSTRDFASVKSSNSSQLADTLSTGSRPEKPTEPFQSRDFNSLSGGENVNNQALSKTVKDSSDSTDRWSKKFAQSATPDNRRDHSPTPPHYKRRIAMDQANNSNFVPFVPFPPDYFAKDKQPEAMEKSATESSYVSVGNDKSIPQKVEENRIGYSYEGGANNTGQTATPKTSGDTRNCGFSRTNLDGRNVAQQTSSIWNNNPASRGSAIAREVTTDGVSASSNLNRQQVENPQKTTENWNHGFPGKSLEGSAVTEPDPLDMSEEAKAQRWFRRVAQIKDISELSKIPDEDFPEIMPMRKGVNRFVVSKRKTPLERRLTSPQYRRNLPIVSSEPGKDPARE